MCLSSSDEHTEKEIRKSKEHKNQQDVRLKNGMRMDRKFTDIPWCVVFCFFGMCELIICFYAIGNGNV